VSTNNNEIEYFLELYYYRDIVLENDETRYCIEKWWKIVYSTFWNL